MNNLKLTKRVESLCEKLRDNSSENILQIDFNSFSEAEKILFHKVDEIEEEYRKTGSVELLAENSDLISKNLEVILRRVTELYCYVVPMVLGSDGSYEIVKYFFKLHFYNFEADLIECLAHVRTWSKKDREEFLLDLRKNGAFFFRIPRGFSEYNDKGYTDLNNSKNLDKQKEEKKEK